LCVVALVCTSEAVASSLELVLIVSSPEGYGAPWGMVGEGEGAGEGEGEGTFVGTA